MAHLTKEAIERFLEDTRKRVEAILAVAESAGDSDDENLEDELLPESAFLEAGDPFMISCPQPPPPAYRPRPLQLQSPPARRPRSPSPPLAITSPVGQRRSPPSSPRGPCPQPCHEPGPSGRQAEERRLSPPDLIQLEEWNLMGFDVEDPPRKERGPQAPLKQGRILKGLPTGKRMTRQEETEMIAEDERRCQMMRAMGHSPQKKHFMGIEIPEEVPEWAIGEPGEFVGQEPQWPQDFYQTGGPLPPPYYIPPPPGVLEDYDPLYAPGYQPQHCFPAVAELAPTWDDAPDFYRIDDRPAAPQPLLEEFDPYFQQPQSPRQGPKSPPPFLFPTPSPPAVSGPCPPAERPRSPPPVSSPTPEIQCPPAARPRSPPPNLSGLSDDLLPESMLQEAADPFVISRPQPPHRAITSQVGQRRSIPSSSRGPCPAITSQVGQRRSIPSSSRGPCPQPCPQPGPSGNAQNFVSEAANIVKETRQRVDGALKSRFGFQPRNFTNKK